MDSRNKWPDHEFKLWNDSDAASFESTEYFEGFLADTDIWRYAPNQAVRADIFRYLILEKIGGIYIDFDFEFIQDPLGRFDQASLILAAEGRWFTNSFLGGKKNHPLFKEMNEKIWKHTSPSEIIEGRNILSTTGPQILNLLIARKKFHLDATTLLIPSHILILDASYLLKSKRRNPYLIAEDGTPLGSIARHLYAASWVSAPHRLASRLIQKFLRNLKPFSMLRKIQRRLRVL